MVPTYSVPRKTDCREFQKGGIISSSSLECTSKLQIFGDNIQYLYPRGSFHTKATSPSKTESRTERMPMPAGEHPPNSSTQTKPRESRCLLCRQRDLDAGVPSPSKRPISSRQSQQQNKGLVDLWGIIQRLNTFSVPVGSPWVRIEHGGEIGHAAWKTAHAKGKSGRRCGLAAHAVVCMVTATSTLLMTARVSAAATATAATATSVIIAMSRRLWAVAAALVRLHTSADSLGRNTSTNLNIGLLDTHARLNVASSTSSIGSSQHPLSVGIGEFVNWNHTDTG